ncbi:hypothetical protein GIB67_005732, partial [Kingdonia uniflora]
VFLFKVYCLSVENHSCSRLFDSKFKVCLHFIWVLLDFCFCGSFHLDSTSENGVSVEVFSVENPSRSRLFDSMFKSI